MSLQNTEREVIVKAPWGNIRAVTWGDPKNPPVILGLGRQMPFSTVRPLVLKLTQSFFYITYDLPGNGTSDHLPKGVRFTVFDLIPSLLIVSDHFKCEKFIYIGHSLGTVFGKFFDMAYPGRITRLVEIDPVPLYLTVTPETMGEWYLEIYGSHYDGSAYKKHTGGIDTAPKYSYEEVKKRTVKALYFRDTDDNIDYVKEGYVTQEEDGSYRFRYDQRMKSSFRLPFSPEYLRQLYTHTSTPIFAIYTTDSIEFGYFKQTPFVFDQKAWSNNNYKFKIVKGNHNIHIFDPECMADDISKFLLDGLKAKL